jgi:hypothetical protein
VISGQKKRFGWKILTCHKAGCEKKNPIQPNRGQFTVLRQARQLIPPHLTPKLARVTGVDEKSRTYGPWLHVVTMLYAQISHALSLNVVS